MTSGDDWVTHDPVPRVADDVRFVSVRRSTDEPIKIEIYRDPRLYREGRARGNYRAKSER